MSRTASAPKGLGVFRGASRRFFASFAFFKSAMVMDSLMVNGSLPVVALGTYCVLSARKRCTTGCAFRTEIQNLKARPHQRRRQERPAVCALKVPPGPCSPAVRDAPQQGR